MDCTQETSERRKDLVRRHIHDLSCKQEIVKMKLDTIATMLEENGEYYFAKKLREIVFEMESKH